MELIVLIAVLIVGSFVFVGCNKKGTTDESPGDTIPEERPKYRALFVGISNYLNYDGAINLQTPASNTSKLSKLFNKFKFTEDDLNVSVKTLTNENATKKNIIDSIHAFINDSDEKDVLYFYYMGHGNIRGGNPIISTYNYKYTDYSTMITVHELKAAFDKIKGKKIILLETCHGGNFISKSVREENYDKLVVNVFSSVSKSTFDKGDYYVITSSAGDQLSWENQMFNFSYFCKPFIDGCSGLKADKNSDGIVDMSEIHLYIKEWIDKQPLPQKQDPQIYPEGSSFPIAEY